MPTIPSDRRYRYTARMGLSLGLAITLFLHLLPLEASASGGGPECFSRAHDIGVPAAIREWLPLAQQGDAIAQTCLGSVYLIGFGVPQDATEGLKWIRRAAENGNAYAQAVLGSWYVGGGPLLRDDVESARWLRRAAEQGEHGGQSQLALRYELGAGVPQDLVLAHMWYNLAASNPDSPQPLRELDAEKRNRVARRLSPPQFATAQQMAREWQPKPEKQSGGFARGPSEGPSPSAAAKGPELMATGTGFIVSRRGHVLTNAHVVDGCREVRIVRSPKGRPSAPVLATDRLNDLALLALGAPVPKPASFRDGSRARQGDGVVVLGYALRGLLAAQPNLTTGTISALAGLGNDSRYFQLTAPVQLGNSGGPVLDQSGNVIGVVVGKLDALKLAQYTGDIPQNINFAIQAWVARGFLDSQTIDYETAISTKALQTAEIGERARSFTVAVECWK